MIELLVDNKLIISVVANFLSIILFLPSAWLAIKNFNNIEYEKNIVNGMLFARFASQIMWIYYAYAIGEPMVGLFAVVEFPVVLLMFYTKNVRFKKIKNTGEKSTNISIVKSLLTTMISLAVFYLILFSLIEIFSSFDFVNKVSLIGIVANIFSFISFAPYAISVYKNKDDNVFISNVSNVQTMFIIFWAVSWILYGLSLGSLNVMFSSFINLPISFLLLYLKNFRKNSTHSDKQSQS